MKLRTFRYEYGAGPFATKHELLGKWRTGNCRRAVQYFLYHVRGIFLAPQNILLPEAYQDTGEFIFEESQPIDFTVLETADIIYAEKIGRTSVPDEDSRILHLHTALWAGEPVKE